jgi:hypothetical protein
MPRDRDSGRGRYFFPVQMQEVSVKSALTFTVLAALILIFLFYLSSGHKVPAVPQDERHRNATTDVSCLECHAPGKQAPLEAAHPPKEQCLICHKIKKGM